MLLFNNQEKILYFFRRAGSDCHESARVKPGRARLHQVLPRRNKLAVSGRAGPRPARPHQSLPHRDKLTIKL